MGRESMPLILKQISRRAYRRRGSARRYEESARSREVSNSWRVVIRFYGFMLDPVRDRDFRMQDQTKTNERIVGMEGWNGGASKSQKRKVTGHRGFDPMRECGFDATLDAGGGPLVQEV